MLNMVTQEDIKIFYPAYYPKTKDGKVGGSMSSSVIEEVTSFDMLNPQLFHFNVLHYTSLVQYHKIFISSIVNEDMFGVKLYGYNTNTNSIVKLAVEVDNDKQYNMSGDEITANILTEPKLRNKYSFAEVQENSPIDIGDLDAGKSISVWLKMEVSSVGSNNINDIFKIGIKFKQAENDTEYITKEFDLYHSRINGIANIKYCENINNSTGMINVYFENIDMSALGYENTDAVYAVYVDNIKYCETVGRDVATFRLRNSSVPFDLKVLLLPYHGYSIIFDELDNEFKNRIKFSFVGNKMNFSDTVKHDIYLNSGSGFKFVGNINVLNGVGSGKLIETCNVKV